LEKKKTPVEAFSGLGGRQRASCSRSVGTRPDARWFLALFEATKGEMVVLEVGGTTAVLQPLQVLR